MPWNDNSNGGPWGSGGQGGRGGPGGPWGQGPRGGGPRGPGQQPPDLEDVVRQLQERMRGFFGGGGGKGGGSFAPVALILAAAALVWLAWPGSGWYIVQPNEVGVVLRFGKFHREDGNGLHLKLPYPLEVAETPSAEESRNTSIGGAPTNNRSGAISSETLMLTGDGNIVDLQFRVQWEIGDRPGDVVNHLFKIDDPEGALESVAESAMREIIGQTPLQPILANEIGDISRRTQDLIQETLDDYEAGIEIRNVIIERPALPEAENPADRGDVSRDPLAAFRDVENAEQERQRSIEDARATANQLVPEARGDAERIVQAANAYRDSVIAEAAGEAERFRLIYEQYELAPQVTRERMFLETMEKVLAASNKIIIDDEGGEGVVPYLPLNELGRRATSGATR